MQKKILVVDDAPQIVGFLEKLLEHEGYEVFTALNGVDGIRLNEQENPDLIILDLHMPGMDGVEVLRQVRWADGKVKVIILSGYVDDKVKKETADLDVGKYLPKPFDSQQLFHAINNVLFLKVADELSAAEKQGGL